MKFCQNHWDTLRRAIVSRGGSDFIAANGKECLERVQEDLAGRPQNRSRFDPLMGAHNAIVSNALEMIKSIGQNPLMLMAGDPDHPEWECPICCLNWLSLEHDRTCTEPACKKPKGLTFDDWIDKAADGAMEHIKTLPAT